MKNVGSNAAYRVILFIYSMVVFCLLQFCSEDVLLLFYFIFYKFIYFWLRWVFVAAHGLSLVVASRGYSSLRCAGFSLWWLLLLWSTDSRRAGSVVVAHGF